MPKYNFLNKTGLGEVWGNIKSYINSFTFSKAEINNNLSSKANDSDVVHNNGAETINGIKSFTSAIHALPKAVGTHGYLIKVPFNRGDTESTDGSMLKSTNHATFRIIDKDSNIISEYCTENYVDGKVANIFNIRNTNNNGNQVQSSINHLIDKNAEQDWFYPSRDNKVMLGTSSNKWADVKTVLLNGKTPAYSGDIPDVSNFATKQEIPDISNLALDSSVVHIKGADVIIDSKTFISLYTQSSNPSLWMKNTSFTMGTAPTTNRYSGFWVQDSNGTDTAYIVHQANKNNSQNLKFSVSNTDGSNTYQNALTFQSKIDGTFNIYSDNPANLGTSSKKWTTINGINPGGLSFPSRYSSSMVIDTTGFDTDGGLNSYTPHVDGWLILRAKKNGFSSASLVDNTTAIGATMTSTDELALSSDFNVISIPVKANDNVSINIKRTSGTWYVILVPCQGNV